MGGLPPECLADEIDQQEYLTLLEFCALAIQGGLDWPDYDLHKKMAAFANGYGCWLDQAEAAIDDAPLDEFSRDRWRIALMGAKAFLHARHVEDVYWKKARQEVDTDRSSKLSGSTEPM